MTKLIALALIPAGLLAAGSAEVAEGAQFEATGDLAEQLLTGGQAKLADAPLTETKTPQAPKAVKRTKVRLLVDCPYGNANDVVELDAAEVKTAESGGFADSDKAAVAYALTLDQNKA